MNTHLAGLIQFAADDTNKASYSGSVYYKQLAKYGEWVNPQYPHLSSDPIMTLDEAWGAKIVANFNDNVLGSPVPVPLNHTSDVKENTGRVISLESVPGDGLYGRLRIDDASTSENLDKGIIFDCSISFDWNFTRTDNNKNYGPVLLHVALVNNPYLTEMNTFEKVDAAFSKLDDAFKTVGLSMDAQNVMMLSRDKIKELSNMATEQEQIETETVADDATDTEVETETAEVEAVESEEEAKEGELDATAEETVEEEDTTDELSRLRLENAELQLSREYDQLLAEGKVIPAQKDKILALSKLASGVELSKDTKTDVTSIVLDILRTGKPQFSTDESGSSKEDETVTDTQDQGTEAYKKPSETLTEDELAGFKAVGADPAKMDELAEKDPVYAQALAALARK